MDEQTEVDKIYNKQTNGKSREATLVWRNVNVFVKDKKQRGKNGLKQIVNNSTGCIKPGTLMAVIGSSGAGKSTHMSALAYRNMTGTVVRGEILLNNRPIGPFMHRLSGFVHQDDLFDGNLTVLEHLTFIANLKLDKRISRQEKNALVKSTLTKVGLLDCCSTRIGDTIKGKTISGGEKKRLSFASELLTNPVLLFVDEPTTGLDAYSAQQLVRTLLRLTKQGTTIMCTIHQPSSQLFAMFHEVLLLAEGRICFIGSPSEAVSFFSLNGYHCPATYNPADFLISTVSKVTPKTAKSSSTKATVGGEKDGDSVAQQLCNAFEVCRQDKQMKAIDTFVIIEDDVMYDVRKPLWIYTVFLLIHRNFLIVARDPTIQKLQIVQKIVIAIMTGLCFYGTTKLDQFGIQSVQGALFILLSENTFTPMYSALTLFPKREALFIRERQAGLYDTFQYYLTNVIAFIPGLIIEPVIFTAICYFLVELRPTVYAFVLTSVLAVFVMNIATACGYFFSIAFKSVDLAIAYLVPFDVSLMITSGVFIKLSSIPYVLSWLHHISWLKYANEAMTIIQWDGVTNITCNAQICLRSGADIINQYDFSVDNFITDFYALALLYIAFNVLAFLVLWLRVRYS